MKLRDDKEIKLDTMLQECNQLVENLRVKLKSQIDEVLKLRKDLDLEREEHQLTQLRYDNVKNAINKEVDRLNK